jgi:hypothetical protein
MCAAALERGGDHAEAMAARGYGAGRATALPERPLSHGERLLAACGAGTLVVAAVTLAGAGDFTWYPTLGSTSPEAVTTAVALVLLGLAATVLAARERS